MILEPEGPDMAGAFIQVAYLFRGCLADHNLLCLEARKARQPPK